MKILQKASGGKKVSIKVTIITKNDLSTGKKGTRLCLRAKHLLQKEVHSNA